MEGDGASLNPPQALREARLPRCCLMALIGLLWLGAEHRNPYPLMSGCNKSDNSHALYTYMFTVIHMWVCAHSPVWEHTHSYTHVLSKHLIQQGTIPTLSVSLLSAIRHKSIRLKTCHRDLILCEYTYPRKPCWKDELFLPRTGCLILPVQRLFATSKKWLKERDEKARKKKHFCQDFHC